jgi:hypothetical protein
MSPDYVRAALGAHAIAAEPTQVAAYAASLTALLENTERVAASLEMEAEPSAFQVAQRRSAP